MSKVSIVIPCYNKELYISEAIESALAQTYKDIEIVIVNDCSGDNSAQIIKEYADKYQQIKFIDFDKNEGVIKARNTAIEAAGGEYILPLDADDTIEPTYVEKAVKILEKNKDIGVVYCKVKFFGEKNGNLNCPEFSENYLLYSSCISSCSMFRKKDFIKCGGDRDYMKDGCEDWDLWLYFYENGYLFYRIPENLLNYRILKNDFTRTVTQKENQKDLWKLMVKNHINLYLNNETFYNRLFKKQKNPINKLKKKIKKLSCIIWVVLVLEVIQIMLLGLYIFSAKGM